MAEEHNIILEHLRLIRNDILDLKTEMRHEFGDLKCRVGALEEHLGVLVSSIAQLNKRMDRFDERLTRVENRLGLHDSQH